MAICSIPSLSDPTTGGTTDNIALRRIAVCGAVDDGKSTLISFILQNGHSGRHIGTSVDGLAGEQAQGITVEAGYYSCMDDDGFFTLIDTPGHGEYMGNMAAAASQADGAIIIIDATKGVTDQTRKHSAILSFLGVETIILAVNKMDLVEYDRHIFDHIVADYRTCVRNLNFSDVTGIPVSALCGDNIIKTSIKTPWYRGQSLTVAAGAIPIPQTSHGKNDPLCLPIQYIIHDGNGFTGYAGEIAKGNVSIGDEVILLPSGRQDRIQSVIAHRHPLTNALSGQAVTVTLEKENTVSRGDVLVSAHGEILCENTMYVTLFWMSSKALNPLAPYIFQIATMEVECQAITVEGIIDMHDMTFTDHTKISQYDIARCRIILDRNIPYLPYTLSRTMGGFALIDPMTYETVAMGTIQNNATKKGEHND